MLLQLKLQELDTPLIWPGMRLPRALLTRKQSVSLHMCSATTVHNPLRTYWAGVADYIKLVSGVPVTVCCQFSCMYVV